jgi:predicted peptidase
MKTKDVEIMDIDVKTTILEHEFEVQSIKNKIAGNIYEPEVTLKDKVYPKTYYNHQPGSVAMDETPTKIKAHELQIVGWTLIEDQ